MEKKEKEGVLLCYARSSTRSWGSTHSPSNPRSVWGQGRELKTKSAPPLAPGPAGDVAAGARLLGKSSASPTVASRDPEARGGAPGYHQAQVTRGDAGGSIRPGASEHSLFETPPARENICPANGATRKSLGGRPENHFELPMEGLGFITGFPLSAESSIFKADSLACPEKAGSWG